MLVAIGAGAALKPVAVAAGVEHHVERLRWSPDADPGEVLAAALANTTDHRGGEVLRLDLGVHGLEIPSFYPLKCQLELGVE